MQAPCQILMFSRPVCCFTQLPRLISGRNRMGFSAGMELTILTALRDVQDVAFGLHFHGRIDVAHHHMVRMALPERAHVFGAAGIHQAASGV